MDTKYLLAGAREPSTPIHDESLPDRTKAFLSILRCTVKRETTMWCKRTGHDGVKQYTLCCQSCPSIPLENVSCIGYPEERRELKQQSFLRVTKRPRKSLSTSTALKFSSKRTKDLWEFRGV